MDRREKKILDSQRGQNRNDKDGFVDLQLTNKNKVLTKTDIKEIVNAADQFNKERQNSSCYRILGTINPTISNPLFDLTGDKSWSTFNENFLRDDSYPPDGVPDINYYESLDEHLDEDDGWFGYTNPDITAETNTCQFVFMTPSRDEFTFNTLDTEKNWDLTVTYPVSGYTGYMTDGGLLIVDDTEVNIGGRGLTAFATSVEHNLSQGDEVTITGLTPSSLDGSYRVERRGLNDGQLKTHYFAVNIDHSSLSSSSGARMKRVVSGFISDYYYRIFKKIKTVSSNMISDNDYEMYKPAFAKNFYNDDVAQFVFNEDVDVSELTDNLGRPLSELYLTIVKRDNKGFTKVRSGLDMPYIFNATASDTQIPHINRITNDAGTTHDFLEDNISIGQDEFYGDIVEYNVAEQRETILSKVAHRFNRDNREQSVTLTDLGDDRNGNALSDRDIGPREEGYYYFPHQLMRIRNFSTYIEQGDDNTVGIPDYATDLGDGRIIWRDLLPIGFSSGEVNTVNYPFVNGCHYLHDVFVFKLKRQDAFNQFGLYYVNSNESRIRDPFGIQMVDEFDVNRSEDVC